MPPSPTHTRRPRSPGRPAPLQTPLVCSAGDLDTLISALEWVTLTTALPARAVRCDRLRRRLEKVRSGLRQAQERIRHARGRGDR